MKAGYAESCGVEWECLQESGSLVNGALSTPSMTLDLTGCPSATLQATIPFTKIPIQNGQETGSKSRLGGLEAGWLSKVVLLAGKSLRTSAIAGAR